MKILCSKISHLLTKIRDYSRSRRTLTLHDGTKITRPFSWSPLYGVIFVILVLYFTNLIILSFFKTVGFNTFLTRIPNFFTILNKMVQEVEWGYFPNIIDPILDTLKMAIVGTVIGAGLSLPVAFLASKNIVKNGTVSGLIKLVLSLLRTFPTLLYALIFAFVFGFGTFVGSLSIILFTFAIATKMLYEVIEVMDLSAFTAIETTGANRLKAFWTAILPNIIGNFFSISLYSFEINVRTSAILGFVGAGGIGILLNDGMGLRDYGKVSLMLINLLIIVILIENLSVYLRKKLV